ncbi:MAG: hypothetical protein ACYTEK_23265 [Planctomycetota bacterium]|jgi:hypothetical protein
MLNNSMLRNCIICTSAIAAAINVSFAGVRGITNTSCSPHVKLRSVDIDDVKWTEGFWAERFELCHEVMVPVQRDMVA